MTRENLFDEYMKFEDIMNGKIELEKLNLNPATYLPLLCAGVNNLFGYGYEIPKKVIKGISCLSLPESREEQQEIEFINQIIKDLNTEYAGEFVLRHILSELTYNIHEHAVENIGDSCNAFVAFKENNDKFDISIVDDGLSIPGRFELSCVAFRDDCHAIEKAINNFSTVSRNHYERGNGLWTTIRLIVDGNGGEMLIVSRNGCLYIGEDYYKYCTLDNSRIFKGTLISIRLNKCVVQNIFDLIDVHRTDFYKYGG